MAHQNTAFSPGLPCLTRILILASGWEYTTVRSILGAILFLCTCVGVQRVFALFSSNSRRNNWAVVFFILWPGSMFFLTGYAESLYAPLLVWFFYFVLRKNFFVAACFASVALFTRSPAIILAPVLAISVIVDSLRSNGNWKGVRHASLRCLIYLPVMALGLVGYMILLKLHTGDPLAFQKSYVGWVPYTHGGLDNLAWQGLVPAFTWNHEWPLPTTVGALGFLFIPFLIVPYRCRIPLPLVLFVVVGWLFFLVMDRHHQPFTDMLRWNAVFFPLAFCLSLVLESFAAGVARLTAFLRIGTIEGNRDTLTTVFHGAAVVPLLAFQIHVVGRFVQEMWVS